MNRFPQILVMGQDSACKFEPENRTIAISIRSPGSPTPALSAKLADVLWLEFEDDSFDGWQNRDKGMTPEQGLQVVEFLRRNHGQFDTLLIHCFVGASRSVSMGLALDMEDVGEYQGAPGRIPNRNVFIVTRRACAGYFRGDSMADSPEPILQFFAHAHLPEHLAAVSKPFSDLATTIVTTLPRSAERTVALRKLLESKDAAVRAKLYKEA